MLAAQKAAAAGPSYAQVDVDDLLDDPELEKLHAERLAQLQREAEKRVKMQQKGHGGCCWAPGAAECCRQALGSAAAAALRPLPTSSCAPAFPAVLPPTRPPTRQLTHLPTHPVAPPLPPPPTPTPPTPAGEYEEIEEGAFLEVVTGTPCVVAHFFHRDFDRCRIMDKHLSLLCKKFFDTRFIKLSAPVGGWLGGWAAGLPCFSSVDPCVLG